MRPVLTFVFILLLCGNAPAYTPEAGSDVETGSRGVWAITPDLELPNVLVLGDSISIAYTLRVRDELRGKANVFRPHSPNGKKPENCQGTTAGVREIDRWLAGHQWDVIHFNWGLHDLKHVKVAGASQNSMSFDDPRQAEPDVYQENLAEIVAKLKATGAKLIFATTTPYPAGVKPARLPDDARVYNNIALEIMKANGVEVNDLHALCKGRLKELQQPKNVHFNRKGQELQGETVAEVIQSALVGLGLSAARAGEPVTIESLLKEMVNRDSVARFPETDFRLKQHSSYDRRSKTPDDSKGWFASHDFNNREKDHNFIRIEERDGQQEWVLMDHVGAGAIVRTWMPFKEVPEASLIRFYLDGSTEPVVEGNVCTLLNGSGLIPYPFAHPSLRSAVSFFPIPYARSCKVTVTRQPFFFQFTFREYAKDTPVKTFTMADFEEAKALTEQVGNTLLNPQSSGATKPVRLNTTLAARAEESIVLPTGTAAVRSLTLKQGSYEDPSVTRSVVLKMEFDGRETVWCPVGDFFGTGIGLHPFQGWYRTVAGDGTMSCRWVMPYQESGSISLVNLGNHPVDVQLEAKTGDWVWDHRSLYFNAAWCGQYPVPTRPYSDWNYVTLTGRGVYVGDTLTVMNPVERWWGEGDEKVWVDGEDFPSIFGTGTEDYYGYSWGGISSDFYEHPQGERI